MAPSKNYYNGTVYDPKAYQNVSLPTSIKCVRCKKFRNAHSFAKNRQDDLRKHIHYNGDFNAKSAPIVCMQCAGGQVTELYCIGCDKTKGLDSFSKAQRKKPDRAECWPCLQERLNTEPDAISSDDDSGHGGSGSDSDGDGFYGGGSTVTTMMTNVSITNGSSATGGVSVGVSSPTPSNRPSNRDIGYVSSSAGNSSGGVKASPSASVTSSTITNRPFSVNSNAGGYGLPPHRRGPASVASTSTTTTTNAGSGNFAKVQRGQRKIVMDEAERERRREMEDEEDDKGVEESDSDFD